MFYGRALVINKRSFRDSWKDDLKKLGARFSQVHGKYYVEVLPKWRKKYLPKKPVPKSPLKKRGPKKGVKMRTWSPDEDKLLIEVVNSKTMTLKNIATEYVERAKKNDLPTRTKNAIMNHVSQLRGRDKLPQVYSPRTRKPVETKSPAVIASDKLAQQVDVYLLAQLYFKCGVCQQTKPLSEAVLNQKHLNFEQTQKGNSVEVTVSQEVLLSCKDCSQRLLPRTEVRT